MEYFTGRERIIKFHINYETPCTHTPVPTECLNKQVPFKAEIIHKVAFIWKHVLGFSNIVTDGFIHSFSYPPKTSFVYTTFKCIIPKGTEYFIGEHNDYASKEIIFLKEINIY